MPVVSLVTLALWGYEGKYWLFVVGFAVGAYLKSIPKYAAVVSFLFGVVEGTLQSYFIFLQVGILSGILARGL